MALLTGRHTKGKGHFSNIVLLLKMYLFKVQKLAQPTNPLPFPTH